MAPRGATIWCLAALSVAACGESPGAGRADCSDPGPWRALLESHRARYHAMEIPDAFKLLQQATMGSEHAAPDSADATAWMEREWSGLGDGPEEPLIDTLGRHGRYARVHLRAYREAGGDPARLTAAFVATANAATGDTTQLGCALDAVAPVVPWDTAHWRAEATTWRRAGFPAMHHSPGYEAAHHPAYRVIVVERSASLFETRP